MIQNTSIDSDQDSPATLKGVIWAVVTGAAFIIFILLMWHGALRAQLVLAEFGQRKAEKRADAFQKERDRLWQLRAEEVRALQVQLAKSEAARREAEQAVRAGAENVGRLSHSGSSVVADAGAQLSTKALTTVPSEQEILAFIEQHLSRLTGPTDVSDYADDTAFHDKSHASPRMIENERRQWALRYPVRDIKLKDDVRPSVSVIRKPGSTWLATVTFDWAWQYRSRSGSAVSGVTRDTWKIIPSADGFKIAAEHSADPVTRQSKD